MERPSKILEWLHISRITYTSLKIPEGMNFSAFLHICVTFIQQATNMHKEAPCNTFLGPSPAIKGSAALIVYLLTHHI